MTVRLVDVGWGAELTDALRADASKLRVITPFIKAGALDRLLSLNRSDCVRRSVFLVLVVMPVLAVPFVRAVMN